MCSTDTLTCRLVGPAPRWQAAVDADGPGRCLQQRYVGQHQRRIGGAQRGPACLMEASSTQRRDVAVVVAEDQPLTRAFGQATSGKDTRSPRDQGEQNCG